MKRIATLAALLTIALCAPATTAQCQSWCQGPCYAPYGCGKTCTCIQPNGPGTQGFCNG